MRMMALVLVLLSFGCAGTALQGRAPGAVRGPWGAGDAEGPVRYLDWSAGVGTAVKNWADRGADEDAWFPAYETSFIYHAGYAWDVEYSAWFGRFIHPSTGWKLQSVVHCLSLRWTRPLGLGWWHLSAGAGWADNDDVDAHDAPAYKFAFGFTYPLGPLNLGASAGYVVNETHHLDCWGGDPISLSVPSVMLSVTASF